MDIEAEDVELEDYVFSPLETVENGEKIYDFTGVENNKIYLFNNKNILEKQRPSWIPELDAEYLEWNHFIPICIRDENDNYYVLAQKKNGTEKAVTGKKVKTHTHFDNVAIYKMNLSVLSATVDYYLKKQKALTNKRYTLPKSIYTMSWQRMNGMLQLMQKFNINSEAVKYLKLYNPTDTQSNLGWTMWKIILESYKDKKLDMNLQKADLASTYEKGEETAYGDSGCDDSLLDSYGIRFKKQNGKSFLIEQSKLLQSTIDKVWKHYGSDFLKAAANKYGLKISYADNVNQHASKWVGIFTPYFNAIGVSFFNAADIERIVPDCILAHETAHWLDSLKGKERNHWFASDVYGTPENKIAAAYKKELKVLTASKKLSPYWYRTCECFARALEQDYAIKNNIKIDEKGYLPEDWFRENIQPMVQNLLEENRRYFTEKYMNLKTLNNIFPDVIGNSLYKNIKDNASLEKLRIEAKKGDREAAAKFVTEVVSVDSINKLKEISQDAIVCPVIAEEANGINKLPLAYATLLSFYGFKTTEDIVQISRTHHTGANSTTRLLNRSHFTGEVEAGKKYILIDDHIDSGATLRDLKDYIESKNGIVSCFSVLTYLPQSTKILPSEENLDKLNLYGEKLDELLRKYDIAANRYCLTNAEITELTGLLSDRSRNKLFENDRQRRFLEDCRIIQNEVSEKLSLQKRITPVKNRLKHVTQSLSEKNILTDEISAILKSLDSGNELLISRINSFNKQEYNPKKSVYDENILIQDIKDILVPAIHTNSLEINSTSNDLPNNKQTYEDTSMNDNTTLKQISEMTENEIAGEIKSILDNVQMKYEKSSITSGLKSMIKQVAKNDVRLNELFNKFYSTRFTTLEELRNAYNYEKELIKKDEDNHSYAVNHPGEYARNLYSNYVYKKVMKVLIEQKEAALNDEQQGFNFDEDELPWNEHISKEMENRIDSGEIFGTNESSLKSSEEKTAIEIPKSLSRKLSSRNTIWFSNQGKTVKDMVDYIAKLNMVDFSLEKKNEHQLYIQGYDNGYKPRGRMRIDIAELQYLYNKMTNENKKERLLKRFLDLTGKALFEDFDVVESSEHWNKSNIKESNMETQKYRYYLKNRPVAIGTQPSGFTASFNYDQPGNLQSMKDAGFYCHGWVEYDHPLTEKEMDNYELKQSVMEPPLSQEEINSLSENGQFVLNKASSGILGKYINSTNTLYIDDFAVYAARNITGNEDYFKQMWNLGIKYQLLKELIPVPIPEDVMNQSLEDYLKELPHCLEKGQCEYNDEKGEFYKALEVPLSPLQVRSLLRGTKYEYQYGNTKAFLGSNYHALHVTVSKDKTVNLDLQLDVSDINPDKPVITLKINDEMNEGFKKSVLTGFFEQIKKLPSYPENPQSKNLNGRYVPEFVLETAESWNQNKTSISYVLKDASEVAEFGISDFNPVGNLLLSENERKFMNKNETEDVIIGNDDVKEKLTLLRTITNNAGTQHNVWEILGHLINRCDTEAFKDLCEKVSQIDIRACFPDYDGDIFAEKREEFNTLWYNKEFEDYLKEKSPENQRVALTPFKEMMDKFWEENNVSEEYFKIHKNERKEIDELNNEQLLDLYKNNPSNYEILSRICEVMEEMQQKERNVPLLYRPYEQVKCLSSNETLDKSIHESYVDTWSSDYRKEQFLSLFDSNRSADEIFKEIAHAGAIRTSRKNSIQDMNSFIREEIKKRDEFSALEKSEKENILEKELLEGHAVYLSIPDEYYESKKGLDTYQYLRIIPDKGRYSVYGNLHGVWKKPEKIKELKISNELRDAIKEHRVFELLDSYGFTPYSYENDMETNERKLNDTFDQSVYEGLKEYGGNGDTELYKKRIKTYVNKDITFRDVCTILNHSEGIDSNGKRFIDVLGTQQEDIINDITYLISKKNMEFSSRTNNSNGLKLYESAAERIRPKLYSYSQDITVYDYDGKKYEVIDGTLYSATGSFGQNMMFIAKEIGSAEYKVFEALKGETISPDGSTFNSLGEAKDYVLFEKHPNKTNVSLDWQLFKLFEFLPEEKYNEYVNDRNLWYEDMKRDLLSYSGNFVSYDRLSFNEAELIEESLKDGKLYDFNDLLKKKNNIAEEIKKHSLIIEGTIDLRRNYMDNRMNDKRTFADKEYMQKIRDYGYEFPVIVYEGNEGYKNKYTGLIEDKVYEIGEFEKIMSEIDAENKPDVYGYDKSYFIVIDEDGEIHDERYDIGDRLGGFVKGLHKEWDYIEDKLKGNPDFKNLYDTREEAEARHEGQAKWIKTLDDAIEKWNLKHSLDHATEESKTVVPFTENPKLKSLAKNMNINVEIDDSEIKFTSASRAISSLNLDTDKMSPQTLYRLTGIKVRDVCDEVILTAHYYYDNKKIDPEYDVNNCIQSKDNLQYGLSITEFEKGIGIRSYLLHGNEYYHDGNINIPIKAPFLCETAADQYLRNTEGSMYSVRNYIGSRAYLLDNSVIPLEDGCYPDKTSNKMIVYDENELSFESLESILYKSETLNKMFKPELDYLSDVERIKRFYDLHKETGATAVQAVLSQFVRDWGKAKKMDDIPQIYTTAGALYRQLVKIAKGSESWSEEDLIKTKKVCNDFIKTRSVKSSPCLIYSPSSVLEELNKSLGNTGLSLSDLRDIEKNISFVLYENEPKINETLIIDSVKKTLDSIISSDNKGRTIIVTDSVIDKIVDFEKTYNTVTDGWNETHQKSDAAELIFSQLFKEYPEISKTALQNKNTKLYQLAFEYAYYKAIQEDSYSDSYEGSYKLLNLKAEYEIFTGNIKYPVAAVRYTDSDELKSDSIMNLKDFNETVKKIDENQSQKKEEDDYLKNIDVNIITESGVYHWDCVVGDGKGGFIDRIDSDWEIKPAGNVIESIRDSYDAWLSNDVTTKNKSFNFFVKDVSAFNEMPSVTGLDAKEAVEIYNDWISLGKEPGIGINIPGDSLYEDKKGEGKVVFAKEKLNQKLISDEKSVKNILFNDALETIMSELKIQGVVVENKETKKSDRLMSNATALTDNINIEGTSFSFNLKIPASSQNNDKEIKEILSALTQKTSDGKDFYHVELKDNFINISKDLNEGNYSFLENNNAMSVQKYLLSKIDDFSKQARQDSVIVMFQYFLKENNIEAIKEMLENKELYNINLNDKHNEISSFDIINKNDSLKASLSAYLPAEQIVQVNKREKDMLLDFSADYKNIEIRFNKNISADMRYELKKMNMYYNIREKHWFMENNSANLDNIEKFMKNKFPRDYHDYKDSISEQKFDSLSKTVYEYLKENNLENTPENLFVNIRKICNNCKELNFQYRKIFEALYRDPSISDEIRTPMYDLVAKGCKNAEEINESLFNKIWNEDSKKKIEINKDRDFELRG